ncbi:uncharacterized protein LOC110033441 [Phalaenopsis equestris]|uniref:uncharacterized protein LOC110033441 n=1 Tax=Phalaenopsis equestris TaxID=78828 RepID=UPI0009E4949B|nr:uncharacterized protein LOC110033441 [Phalaenopsis equestris]
MVRCLPTTAGRACAGEITSIYTTHLGTITLTWSRTSLGVFLLADLLLTPSPSPANNNDNAISDHLRLCIRPYLTWKRKGSKHRRFRSANDRRRVVELVWDFSLATFCRGPEPTGGFFLSISVDSEIALVVGDSEEKDCRLTGSLKSKISGKRSELISRRERVRFGGIGDEMSHVTKGWFEGKEMAISIFVDVEGEEMRIGIDGEIVLEVSKICWKFRGSDGAALKTPSAIGEAGEAVFVLRFERGEGWEERAIFEGRGCFCKGDWSDSSSGSLSGSSVEELECCGEGIAAELRRRRVRPSCLWTLVSEDSMKSSSAAMWSFANSKTFEKVFGLSKFRSYLNRLLWIPNFRTLQEVLLEIEGWDDLIRKVFKPSECGFIQRGQKQQMLQSAGKESLGPSVGRSPGLADHRANCGALANCLEELSEGE